MNHSLELSENFIQELTGAQPRLYGFIFKRLMQVEATKEVLQETNVVLCRKHADFKEGTSFIAWAFQVAHFQTLSYCQKRNRDRLVFDDALIEYLPEEENTDQSHSNERIQALEHCMEKLSPKQRQILAARYSKHGNVKALAESTGKSANAISKILQRTRGDLLKCITNQLKDRHA